MSESISITFDVKTFKRAFDLASKVVPSRSPKPILSMIRLIIGDDSASLEATDLERGIRVPFACRTQGKGAVMLDPARIKAFIKSVPKGQAMAEFVVGDDSVSLRSGDFSLSVPVGDNPDYFPTMPTWTQDKASWAIPSPQFLAGFDQVEYATDPESTRYALGAILIETAMDGTANFVATCGKRLARRTVDCQAEGRGERPANLLVPRWSLSIVADVARKTQGADVRVQGIEDGAMVFSVGDVEVYARTMEGRFPRYADCYPSNYDLMVRMPRQLATELVNQAQATNTPEVKRGPNRADAQESMDIIFDPETQTALVETERDGRVAFSRSVKLSIDGGSEARFIRINSRFLAEAIRTMDGDDVVVKVVDEWNAMTVADGTGRFSYLTMPLGVGDRPKGQKRYRLSTHGIAMLARLRSVPVESIPVPAPFVGIVSLWPNNQGWTVETEQGDANVWAVNSGTRVCVPIEPGRDRIGIVASKATDPESAVRLCMERGRIVTIHDSREDDQWTILDPESVADPIQDTPERGTPVVDPIDETIIVRCAAMAPAESAGVEPTSPVKPLKSRERKSRTVDPTTIKTHWCGYLQTYPDPADPGRSGCGLGTSGDTQDECHKSVIEGAEYYRGLGYKVVIEYLQQACSACQGTGRTRKGKRVIKTVDCPTCKGQGTFEKTPPVPYCDFSEPIDPCMSPVPAEQAPVEPPASLPDPTPAGPPAEFSDPAPAPPSDDFPDESDPIDPEPMPIEDDGERVEDFPSDDDTPAYPSDDFPTAPPFVPASKVGEYDPTSPRPWVANRDEQPGVLHTAGRYAVERLANGRCLVYCPDRPGHWVLETHNMEHAISQADSAHQAEIDAAERERRDLVAVADILIHWEVLRVLEGISDRSDRGAIRRASIETWDAMTDEEQRDFAAWCDAIDYQPGFADNGRLAPDEAFDAFILECVTGSPIYLPSHFPTDPGPDDGEDFVLAHLRDGLGDEAFINPEWASSPELAMMGCLIPRIGVSPEAPLPPFLGDDRCRTETATTLLMIRDSATRSANTAGNRPRTSDSSPETGDTPTVATTPRPMPSPTSPTDLDAMPRPINAIIIEGTPYAYEIGPDGIILEKPDGSRHAITSGPDGPSCSCSSFAWRPGPCKHGLALIEAGLLPAEIGPDDFPEPTPEDWDELYSNRPDDDHDTPSGEWDRPCPDDFPEDHATMTPDEARELLSVHGLAPICGGSDEAEERPMTPEDLLVVAAITQAEKQPTLHVFGFEHPDPQRGFVVGFGLPYGNARFTANTKRMKEAIGNVTSDGRYSIVDDGRWERVEVIRTK